MADTNLFPDEPSFTPRPAWQVIEAARRQYLTGELALPTNPATRIFLRDGMVYFAERSSDGTLPVRLMMEGVITREQMQRGTVIVNGVEHVGRMFEADPTIDRSSVELCTELFTEDVMVSVANTMVSSYELHLYRRHSSGIDRWYPHSVPAATKSNESQAAEQATAQEPKPKVAATSQVAKAPARPKPQPETRTASPTGPRNSLTGPPITQAVPVTRPVTATAATATPPPPPITQAVPVTHAAPVTTQVPVTMPAPTAQIPVTESGSTATATAASDEVDTTAIADEVAEAIRRAFAGMGAGF